MTTGQFNDARLRHHAITKRWAVIALLAFLALMLCAWAVESSTVSLTLFGMAIATMFGFNALSQQRLKDFGLVCVLCSKSLDGEAGNRTGVTGKCGHCGAFLFDPVAPGKIMLVLESTTSGFTAAALSRFFRESGSTEVDTQRVVETFQRGIPLSLEFADVDRAEEVARELARIGVETSVLRPRVE